MNLPGHRVGARSVVHLMGEIENAVSETFCDRKPGVDQDKVPGGQRPELSHAVTLGLAFLPLLFGGGLLWQARWHGRDLDEGEHFFRTPGREDHPRRGVEETPDRAL